MAQRARDDVRVIAAAWLGSAARGEEDAWSDIDLALRLAKGADAAAVLSDWSTWLASTVEVSDTMDVYASGAVYRVFLCRDSLQIDLSVFPWDKFRATNGEPLRILFGEAEAPEAAPEPAWRTQVRMGWLYALHARSAIRRGRTLQADLMLAEWRACVIALACERLGLDRRHARAAHLLPPDLHSALEHARPPRLSQEELEISLARTAAVYLEEVGRHDLDYSNELRHAMNAIAV
jgi:predicted nucleotidyltransferase